MEDDAPEMGQIGGKGRFRDPYRVRTKRYRVWIPDMCPVVKHSVFTVLAEILFWA